MTNSTDVVVAGHICFDIIPKMISGGNVINDILRPGKLVHVEKAKVSSGGPVSNTGLALNRLGICVELMGKCGNDMFGHALIQKIKDEADGAEKGMQIVDGETTSYTVVISPPGIDRIFLHCSGANDTFGADDINTDIVKRAKLFHFGYPPLMARMYKNGGDELAEIFEEVKATGATTSLDMALPDPSGPSGKVDWAGILKKTLPNVDLFLPSAEELTFMLQRSTFDNLLKQVGNNDLLGQISGKLLSNLAERCIEMGAAIIVIKCGYLGAYIRTAGKKRLEKIGAAKPGNIQNWTEREIFEPSFQVSQTVSATGSGDNAIAGFLAAYLHKLDVEDTLRFLCAVGAHNVQVPDAISGVKSWKQTSDEIQSGWLKNDINISLDGWKYDSEAKHYLGPNDKTP